ncbi:MAG: acetoacetate decarboxylase family protein [Hyphomicrobiaceae bacterium]|nr:acetoacetate decarboxylase family protein [Hyphomicrobiaceae bacterium]MCC0023827.1 acetoacetate decarboxylase family protein [Hyphomicrobiaceae bacterium]
MNRKELLDQTIRLRTRQSRESAPLPYYHVNGIDMIYIMCRFGRDQVAKVLPPGLEPAESGWGVFNFYTANAGWSIAPYSAFYLGVEVAGYDSPDGQPGLFLHMGHYSENAFGAMERYNTRLRPGHMDWDHVPGELRARGFAGNTELINVRAAAPSAPFHLKEGINRYLGVHPECGISSFYVPFSCEYVDLETPEITYLSEAAQHFHPLVPEEIVWPIAVRNMTITFSPPRRLGVEDTQLVSDQRAVGLLDAFARSGRAAAIVDASSRILRLNPVAETLSQSGFLPLANGRMTSWQKADAARLEEVVAATAVQRDGRVSDQIALEGRHGRLMLAQALSLEPSVVGDGRVIVLFDDPAEGPQGDCVPALRLLGLTEAEAKIAALVGAGRSPAEAADALELSVNTVRSALKLIYDKLGIGRQAELAKIVTRLESRAIA